jgi:hypothetical protein
LRGTATISRQRRRQAAALTPGDDCYDRADIARPAACGGTGFFISGERGAESGEQDETISGSQLLALCSLLLGVDRGRGSSMIDVGGCI